MFLNIRELLKSLENGTSGTGGTEVVTLSAEFMGCLMLRHIKNSLMI